MPVQAEWKALCKPAKVMSEDDYYDDREQVFQEPFVTSATSKLLSESLVSYSLRAWSSKTMDSGDGKLLYGIRAAVGAA
jgi:hypothetical protein